MTTSASHSGDSSYLKAVEKVLALRNFEVQRSSGQDYTLVNVKAVLAELGNPQDRVPAVHIAGTKGKGSVASMVASTLRNVARVGMFTSPHLHTIRERIQINGRPISKRAFTRLACRVLQFGTEGSSLTGTGRLTTFEALTAIGFLAFADSGCQANVIECGLGGRLDATNVVSNPACTAVTTIGLDHTEILGSTLSLIAMEKVAIARRGRPMVVSPQVSSEALRTLVAGANGLGAVVVDVSREYRMERLSQSLRGQLLRVERQCRPAITFRLPLLGRFQLSNVATAIAVCDVLANDGWPITDEIIGRGLATVRWPARLEVVSRRPLVLVDGAHNEVSIAELLATVSEDWPDRRLVAVIGVSADKDLAAIARVLRSFGVTDPYLVQSRHPRAMAARLLADQLDAGQPMVSLGAAMAAATSAAEDTGLVLVFGSLFVAAEARELALGLTAEAA